jgi:WD40 repeat protein
MCRLLLAGLAPSLVFLLTAAATVAEPQQGRDASRQKPPGPTGEPLPPGAVARLGSGRLIHYDEVEDLAFAADGKTLASVDRAAAVRLWDTTTGAERARFALPPDKGYGWRIGLSPGAKVVAFTGAGGQPLQLCDAGTGKVLRKFQWPGLNWNSGWPLFAFTPDGKKFAARTGDSTLRMWDVSTGRQLGSFALLARGVGKRSRSAVKYIAFAPDGKTLGVVTDDGFAELWDTVSGKQLRRLHEGRYQIYTLAISPDGKTAATGCDNGVRLSETATGKARRWLGGFAQAVKAVAFSPDGLTLSAASDDGYCRVWRVSDGKELQRVRVIKPGVPIRNPLRRLAISGDGKVLAWVGWDNVNRIRLSDVHTGLERLDSGDQPRGFLVAFAPDSKTAATPCEDGRIRLRETATGKVIRVLEGKPIPVIWLGFSPDSRTVIAAGAEIVFYDVATGKELRRCAAPRIPFERQTCALSPGGKFLAVGEVVHSRHPVAREHRVLLWDLGEGKELRSCQGGHQASIMALAFSADGKRLASIGRDRVVYVWEVATGQEVHHYQWAPEGNNGAIAFAEDGKSVLACATHINTQNKEVCEVMRGDLVTGKTTARLECVGLGFVNFLPVLSPTGKLLACAHRPGGIDVSDTRTGQVVRQLRVAQEWQIRPLAFSPDGRLLASWHGDSTILLWDVSGLK